MAIEKTPSKNWELTLYEMQRTPQPLITDDSEIAICPLRLSNELKCPICLDFLNNTMATKECLHRFCAQCIVTALRSGNKECPACRKKLVSKRSLRHDHNFDAIIAKLFPYRKEYEAHQANVMAKQIRNSMRSSTSKDGNSNDTDGRSTNDQNNGDNGLNEDDSKVSDSSESVIPVKRMRRCSSESGEPETNGSSSIASELCSLLGNNNNNHSSITTTNNNVHGRDGITLQISFNKDSEHHISNIYEPSTSATNTVNNNMNSIATTDATKNFMLDLVLEPLDGRMGRHKLSETFLLQLSDKVSVGHLNEFLVMKRNESTLNRSRHSDLDYYKLKHLSGSHDDSVPVKYKLFLAMSAISSVDRKHSAVKDQSNTQTLTNKHAASSDTLVNSELKSTTVNNSSIANQSAASNNQSNQTAPSITTQSVSISKVQSTKKSHNRPLEYHELLGSCIKNSKMKSRRHRKSHLQEDTESGTIIGQVATIENLVECFVLYYQEILPNIDVNTSAN